MPHASHTNDRRNPPSGEALRSGTSAALTLAIVFLLPACSRQPPPPEPPRPVLSRTVTLTQEAALAVYSGEVRARHEAALSFQVGGKLAARSAELGTRVKAGQDLARLDPADTSLGSAASTAELAAARSGRSLAHTELERFRELLAKKFISQAAFDQRKAEADAADARVLALEAQSQLSRRREGYTVLRADHEGVVSRVLAEPGQVLAAGQPVLVLAREDEKEVAVSIPESRMAELKRAGQVRVELWAPDLPQRSFEGRLREVSPMADPATRTYPARVSILGADASVLLGMTASVSFLETGTPPVITLPLSAIYQQGKEPAVWVVGKDLKVSLRPVTVRDFSQDGAHVSAGLNPGERVVTAGVHMLVPNEQVALLPEAAR